MFTIPSMRSLMEAILPEHWETMRLPDGGEINIGWQIAKDAQNQRNHAGLSLHDGIAVLADPQNKSTLDYDNHSREEREKYLGRGSGGQMLVVVVEWVDTEEEMAAARIISVRKAEFHEINGDTMNEEVKPNEPEIDPDNPPLTGKEVWQSGQESIKNRIAQHKAKVTARKAQEQPKAAE